MWFDQTQWFDQWPSDPLPLPVRWPVRFLKLCTKPTLTETATMDKTVSRKKKKSQTDNTSNMWFEDANVSDQNSNLSKKIDIIFLFLFWRRRLISHWGGIEWRVLLKWYYLAKSMEMISVSVNKLANPVTLSLKWNIQYDIVRLTSIYHFLFVQKKLAVQYYKKSIWQVLASFSSPKKSLIVSR